MSLRRAEAAVVGAHLGVYALQGTTAFREALELARKREYRVEERSRPGCSGRAFLDHELGALSRQRFEFCWRKVVERGV